MGSAQRTAENPFVTESSSTVEYCAPEMFCKKAFEGDKADIWSLGVLLHILVTGSWPYVGETFEEAVENIRKGIVEINCKFPKSLVPLLKSLLAKEPSERPSARQIIAQVMRTNYKITLPVSHNSTISKTRFDNFADNVLRYSA